MQARSLQARFLRTRFGLFSLVTVAIGMLCTPSMGMVTSTSNISTYTAAPTGDKGWSSVGTMSTGTGVYLGDGWVLTAYHVYDDVTTGQSITLNGTTYTEAAAGSGTRLTNPDGTTADLVLYKLSATPTVSGAAVSSTSAAVGTSVVMIGAGRTQESSLTYWHVDTSTTPWTWTETSVNANASGYDTTSTRTKTWGTNTITAYDSTTTWAFYTTFSNTNGTARRPRATPAAACSPTIPPQASGN